MERSGPRIPGTIANHSSLCSSRWTAKIEKLPEGQIIAQDAASGAIRSWLFQGGGGLGEAMWTREGKDWRVDSGGVER